MAGILGSLGLDFGAAGAQSSPFYNDSGIYFKSPGAGGIDAGPVSATAVPRSQAGLNQALPDSMIPNGSFSAESSGGLIYYVIGAIIFIGIGGYLAFRKS